MSHRVVRLSAWKVISVDKSFAPANSVYSFYATFGFPFPCPVIVAAAFSLPSIRVFALGELEQRGLVPVVLVFRPPCQECVSAL